MKREKKEKPLEEEGIEFQKGKGKVKIEEEKDEKDEVKEQVEEEVYEEKYRKRNICLGVWRLN